MGTVLWGNGTASGTNAVCGGTDAVASGDDSIAFGVQAEATQTVAIAIGAYCEAGGNGSAALGESCTTSAPNGIAIGYNSHSTAYSGVAIGEGCNADADNSYCFGVVCSTQRAGEFAHAGGLFSGHGQGMHANDLGCVLNGATGVMTLFNNDSYLLDSYFLTSLRVRIIAREQGSTGKFACEVWEMLVNVLGSSISVVNCTPVYQPSGHTLDSCGWSVTPTGEGTKELRFTCNPGSDHVRFFARIEFASLAWP